MLHSIQARTLRKAAEVLGGLEPLERHLKVPRADLVSWTIGTSPPPVAVFLQAVDLLLAYTSPGAAGMEANSPEAKASPLTSRGSA